MFDGPVTYDFSLIFSIFLNGTGFICRFQLDSLEKWFYDQGIKTGLQI